MTISELCKILAKVIVAIMVGLFGFLIDRSYDRLCSVEKELINLRLEVAQLQILTKPEVREIVQVEIHKYMRQLHQNP